MKPIIVVIIRTSLWMGTVPYRIHGDSVVMLEVSGALRCSLKLIRWVHHADLWWGVRGQTGGFYRLSGRVIDCHLSEITESVFLHVKSGNGGHVSCLYGRRPPPAGHGAPAHPTGSLTFIPRLPGRRLREGNKRLLFVLKKKSRASRNQQPHDSTIFLYPELQCHAVTSPLF